MVLVDPQGQPLPTVKQQGDPAFTPWRPQAGLGFDAGGLGRRLRAIPSTPTTLNSQIRSYGLTVLARSRYLCLNNAYAKHAKSAFVSALVGNGIMPSPTTPDLALKGEMLDLWEDWGRELDADGLVDVYGLEQMVAGELFEAGEVFLRFRQRMPSDGLTIPLQIQVLPAEMLALSRNLILPDGGRVEMGVEFDALNRRVAYHFYQVNPGTDLPFSLLVGVFTRVPASEVLHIFQPIRAGQVRGVPHTLASITTLALLDMYDDAELERKRVAALFAAFVTRQPSDTGDDDPLGVQSIVNPDTTTAQSPVMEPGATIDLLPGEDVKFAAPADVGSSYEVFQYRNLLKAAAGFGVPYGEVTGDLSHANFGSIRAGLITFRRRVSALQTNLMGFQFCRPVWRQFLEAAVMEGALPISPRTYLLRRRELLRVTWVPPRWEWIDPLRDIQAEKLAVDNHFKPRAQVIQEGEGLDPEWVDEQIRADREREQKMGNIYPGGQLFVAAAGAGAPAAGGSSGSGGAQQAGGGQGPSNKRVLRTSVTGFDADGNIDSFFTEEVDRSETRVTERDEMGRVTAFERRRV